MSWMEEKAQSQPPRPTTVQNPQGTSQCGGYHFGQHLGLNWRPLKLKAWAKEAGCVRESCNRHSSSVGGTCNYHYWVTYVGAHRHNIGPWISAETIKEERNSTPGEVTNHPTSVCIEPKAK